MVTHRQKPRDHNLNACHHVFDEVLQTKRNHQRGDAQRSGNAVDNYLKVRGLRNAEHLLDAADNADVI